MTISPITTPTLTPNIEHYSIPSRIFLAVALIFLAIPAFLCAKKDWLSRTWTIVKEGFLPIPEIPRAPSPPEPPPQTKHTKRRRHHPLFTQTPLPTGRPSLSPPPQLQTFSPNLSREQEDAIRQILHTLATYSNFYLPFERIRLNTLGSLLTDVSCLRFFGYAHTQQDLKAHFQIIKTRTFVWPHFIAPFREKFTREVQSDTFFEDLKSFARFVNIDHERLSRAATNSCEEFLDLLM